MLVSCTPACSTQRNAGSSAATSTSSIAITPPDAGRASDPRDAGVEDAETGETEASDPIPEPTFDEIARVLFAERAQPVPAACGSSLPGEARIRCLYDERYRGDTKGASLAHELYVKWRIVAGVEVAHTMDGGFRGSIRLEPAVPIGADRKHLEWIVSAMRDFDTFFAELDRFASRSAKRGASRGAPTRYRFRSLTLRFTRSVGRTTPSAYAHDWTIAWNVAGSLHTSADAVRETLFHEIFHLNDSAHSSWSPGALNALYRPIVTKCGASSACQKPYTPNDTMVRGGSYYAFQQGNGDSVMEYAAELALRYYREQRATLRDLPKVAAFKCGPAPNVRAWALMRDEFFGGIDAVPDCEH